MNDEQVWALFVCLVAYTGSLLGLLACIRDSHIPGIVMTTILSVLFFIFVLIVGADL